ncbi:MAG: thioredoxin family protein [Nocardioidaceae bacterium]|nr:thioredoxin family protein [Nocardioidaceae bacterium]MCL2614956.1 thioredoxin family protein [Nocardioidaceae bacterium]
MTGIAILVVAVVAALGFGLYRRYADGRFKGVDTLDQPGVEPVAGAAAGERGDQTPWAALAAALPDVELGERATLVQFSSSFCAPCRTTRVLLGDIAGREHGVTHLEVDAEKHLGLVRALDVRRTPTTLVLDATGAELTRAAGAPRREQVLAVLPEVAR